MCHNVKQMYIKKHVFDENGNLTLIIMSNLIKVRSCWSDNYKIEIDEGIFFLIDMLTPILC